jgi:guanylate kinase
MTDAPSSSRGLLLVISGPSGVGKTTITHAVEERLGAVFSVSATTRAKTNADVVGRDYVFVTEEEFQRRLDGGEFLEHAQVFGQSWYATPRAPVERHLDAGDLVILEIDVQGALQVKRTMPDAYMIFVEPPDEDELLRRLRGRGREDESVIQRRFAEAKREIATAHASGCYDEFIVNDRLEDAIDEAVRLVRQRQGQRPAGATGRDDQAAREFES